MKKPELWIGSRGWRHVSWVGDFYPDDMPMDWWLAYYSNEFDAVLVPWSYLQDAQPEILQTWVDDTDEDFDFFIELPFSASKKQVEMVLEILMPRLGGILLIDISAVTEVTADVKAVANCLESVESHVPVVVSWDSIQLDSSLRSKRHQLGCYWHPEEQELHQCGGSLGIAELNNNSHDPKALKKLLEHCRSVLGPTTIGLFFGGDAPSIDEMRNAIMILQMLG